LDNCFCRENIHSKIAVSRLSREGLKDRIPTSKDGDVDVLSLWIHLYPGKIEHDLCRLNEEGFIKHKVGSMAPNTSGLFLLELSMQLDISIN
jgi:hypothetical protein